MKYLMIVMILSLSIYADEMQRMEAVLKDIENLRSDYNRCIKELDIKNMDKTILKKDVDTRLKAQLQEKDKLMKEYKNLLDKERMKNTLLIAKLDSQSKYSVINESKNNNTENEKYKNIIEKQHKDLESKDKIIKSLNNQIDVKNISVNLSTKDSIHKEIQFKAATFRLEKNSNIYNMIDGDILYTWDKNRSFTSGIMTQNWIKITGYFVNKKWVKAEDELWIKKVNIVKR